MVVVVRGREGESPCYIYPVRKEQGDTGKLFILESCSELVMGRLDMSLGVFILPWASGTLKDRKKDRHVVYTGE